MCNVHTGVHMYGCIYRQVTPPSPPPPTVAVPLKIPLNEIFRLIIGLCDYASCCTATVSALLKIQRHSNFVKDAKILNFFFLLILLKDLQITFSNCICIISRTCLGKHLLTCEQFWHCIYPYAWERKGQRNIWSSAVYQTEHTHILGDNKIYPKTGTRKCRFQLKGWLHGLINYIDTKTKYTKCRHLKKITGKGTVRQVFICLRPPPHLCFCFGWSSNFVGSDTEC